MRKTVAYAFHHSIPILIGFFPVGLAYGLLMQQAGYNFLWSGACSLFVLAGSLLVYCLRGMQFTSAGAWVPQVIAVGVTAGLHWWRRNTLLSIAAGTVCYMLLVQLVF